MKKVKIEIYQIPFIVEYMYEDGEITYFGVSINGSKPFNCAEDFLNERIMSELDEKIHTYESVKEIKDFEPYEYNAA